MNYTFPTDKLYNIADMMMNAMESIQKDIDRLPEGSFEQEQKKLDYQAAKADYESAIEEIKEREERAKNMETSTTNELLFIDNKGGAFYLPTVEEMDEIDALRDEERDREIDNYNYEVVKVETKNGQIVEAIYLDDEDVKIGVKVIIDPDNKDKRVIGNVVSVESKKWNDIAEEAQRANAYIYSEAAYDLMIYEEIMEAMEEDFYDDPFDYDFRC